eukprot:RCo029101
MAAEVGAVVEVLVGRIVELQQLIAHHEEAYPDLAEMRAPHATETSYLNALLGGPQPRLLESARHEGGKPPTGEALGLRREAFESVSLTVEQAVRLRSDNCRLTAENLRLSAENASLVTENALLCKRVEGLEERLAQLMQQSARHR